MQPNASVCRPGVMELAQHASGWLAMASVLLVTAIPRANVVLQHRKKDNKVPGENGIQRWILAACKMVVMDTAFWKSPSTAGLFALHLQSANDPVILQDLAGGRVTKVAEQMTDQVLAQTFAHQSPKEMVLVLEGRLGAMAKDCQCATCAGVRDAEHAWLTWEPTSAEEEYLYSSLIPRLQALV